MYFHSNIILLSALYLLKNNWTNQMKSILYDCDEEEEPYVNRMSCSLTLTILYPLCLWHFYCVWDSTLPWCTCDVCWAEMEGHLVLCHLALSCSPYRPPSLSNIHIPQDSYSTAACHRFLVDFELGPNFEQHCYPDSPKVSPELPVHAGWLPDAVFIPFTKFECI